MKIHPPLFSLLLGVALAGIGWLLDAGTWQIIAALGCGVAYAILYSVVKPRTE